MIQRIQTIYLFLAFSAVALMYFFPLAVIAGPNEEFYFKATGIFKSNGEQLGTAILLSILLALEIVFTFLIIFLYKKRSRQMMMGKLNLLVLTVIIALVFFFADNSKTLTGLPVETLVNYQFTCLLPVISIILNFLAIKAIQKDEDLVRAADRLR